MGKAGRRRWRIKGTHTHYVKASLNVSSNLPRKSCGVRGGGKEALNGPRHTHRGRFSTISRLDYTHTHTHLCQKCRTHTYTHMSAAHALLMRERVRGG